MGEERLIGERAFRAYEVERPDGSWERVERSIPTAEERIRSAEDALPVGAG